MFDRYLRTYQSQSKRKHSKRVEEQLDLKEFRVKWAEFVADEGEDDIKPMLGLDAYEAPPKPMRLYGRYGGSEMYRQTAKLAVDSEIAKLKHNRDQMRHFLHGQQKWLAGLKAGTARRGQDVSVDASLLQLRASLSPIV